MTFASSALVVPAPLPGYGGIMPWALSAIPVTAMFFETTPSYDGTVPPIMFCGKTLLLLLPRPATERIETYPPVWIKKARYKPPTTTMMATILNHRVRQNVFIYFF